MRRTAVKDMKEEKEEAVMEESKEQAKPEQKPKKVIVINKTAHLIIAGGTRFIPNLPTECDFETLKKNYKQLEQDEVEGKLVVANQAQAAFAKEQLEEKTVRQLKAYAKNNGIDTSDATTKVEILKVINEQTGA